MTNGTRPVTATMKQRARNVLLGQAGLATLTCAAATLAGLSPFLPLLAAGVVYGISRFGPLQGVREKHLLARLAKAHIVLEPGDPVYERVATIAQKMNLPVPKIFLMAPRHGNYNVGALTPLHWTAPREGALLIPSSLYDSTRPGRPPVFTDAEQEAVIAHELAHLQNNDSRRMSLNGVLNSCFVFSTGFAVLGLLVGMIAPPVLWTVAGLGVAGQFVERYCQRQIEYRTDATAATYTRDPHALATALEKLSRIQDHITKFHENALDITEIEAPQLYGVQFKPARKGNEDKPVKPPGLLSRLLSTHPDFDSRYANIRAVAADLDAPLPEERPSVAMEESLPAPQDGIVLPPFAIKEAMRYNETHNVVSILTCVHDFNNAANPQTPRQTPRHFPPRRRVRGLDGPWS